MKDSIYFSLLFLLYKFKQKPAEEDNAQAQFDVPFEQLRSVPRTK